MNVVLLLCWPLVLLLAGPSTASNYTLDDILSVYDPYVLVPVWATKRTEVSTDCFVSMERFLHGLRTDELWALKMIDASGRHPTAFFNGNSFWAGSKQLCESVRDDGFSRNMTLPFSVRFYSVKVHLDFLEETHLHDSDVNVGMCLPQDCSQYDVQRITEISLEAAGQLPRKVSVLDTRVLHVTYSPWKETKFLVVVIMTAVVFVLLMIGTVLDLHLRSKESSQSLGMSVTTLLCCQRADPEEQEMKIEKFDGKHNNGKSKNGTFVEVLLAFSVWTNILKIFDISVSKDTLLPLHGVRVLSMMWIIAFHVCTITFNHSDNKVLKEELQRDPTYQGMMGATFAVDNFFLISGLLLSYLYFKRTPSTEDEKSSCSKIRSHCSDYFTQFIRRVLRLTLPYFVLLVLAEVSSKVFREYTVLVHNNDYRTCPKYWWRNLLYISTFYPKDEMCVLWTWYLSNDTQYFAVALALLMIGVYYFRFVAGVLMVLLLSSWTVTGYIVYAYNISARQDAQISNYDLLFVKPWTRVPPYIIGLIVGWILYKTKGKIRINQVVNLVGWFVVFVVTLSVVFGPNNMAIEMNRITSAVYVALSRSAWSIAVSWTIVACVAGYGGIINTMLTWKYLYPLSRLTYCNYLFHPLIVRFMTSQGDGPIHMTISMLAVSALGNILASYLVAIVVCLAFEMPVLALLKIVFDKKKNK